MGKKYKLNVNGAPTDLVNINGAPWQGNMKINGVEVSYEDTPAPPPKPATPPVTTVWKLSAQPLLPVSNWAAWSYGQTTMGPLFPKGVRLGQSNKDFEIKDCFPAIQVSGTKLRARAHAQRGDTPPTDEGETSFLNVWNNSVYSETGSGKWIGFTSKSIPEDN